MVKDSFTAKFSRKLWLVSSGVSYRTFVLTLPCGGVYPPNTTVAALQVSGGGEGRKTPRVALVWLLQTAILGFPAALRHSALKGSL